jgi:hypothetical protein
VPEYDENDFLSEVLTPKDFGHYRRFLGDALRMPPLRPDDGPWEWRADFGSAAPASPPRYRPPRMALPAPRHEAITRIGTGPDRCTSDQRLALQPEICWDVCGYYRRLGVHWRATRKELREAYFEKGAAGAGRGRADLTYALSQLLNKETRYEYDRLPLGALYLKDRDVEAWVKEMAHRAANAMRERGTQMTASDVLRDWGLEAQPRPPGEDGDAGSPPDAYEQPQAETPWMSQWAWYIEQGVTRSEDWTVRLALLGEWQKLLIRAFARCGARVTFGVGLCVDPGFSIRPSYATGTLVILLGPSVPSQQLADDAVTEWGFAEEKKQLSRCRGVLCPTSTRVPTRPRPPPRPTAPALTSCPSSLAMRCSSAR